MTGPTRDPSAPGTPPLGGNLFIILRTLARDEPIALATPPPHLLMAIANTGRWNVNPSPLCRPAKLMKTRSKKARAEPNGAARQGILS